MYRMAPELMAVNNNPNVSNWSLDHGYVGGLTERDYPIRVFNAKQCGSLVLHLRLYKQDLEYLCRGSIQGYKIILTTPGEALKMSRHTFRVPLLEQSEISIIPTWITTSSELNDYEPEQRQCYFSHERPLQFYRFYTQHNCETECISNFTKQVCGCVKFSMPSKSIRFIKRDFCFM